MTQARRVAIDHPRYLRLNKADEFDVLLLGLGAENTQAVIDQCIQVELHVVQFDLPRLQLGDVEDFVDQREQFVAGAVDSLYVITLLDGQRRAEQQLCHAQHAVHWRTDLMADLGQKLGLGIDLGVAGGEVATQVELVFGDAPRSFTQGDAHQQAAETHHRHQGQHQLLRCDQGQPQQGGQDQQGADVENDHGHDKQTSRAVALLQVVTGHQQDAEAGQRNQ